MLSHSFFIIVSLRLDLKLIQSKNLACGLTPVSTELETQW